MGGSVPDRFPGDITISPKVRVSGARLQHLIQGNSLKAYGKAHTPVGDIFRVGTMTSNGAVFSIYRAAEAGPADQLAWREMRLGVADLYGRTVVSPRANERYLDAFATEDDTTRFAELTCP